MILPIVAYGDPVLKKKASLIESNQANLPELIQNMFDTMYHANGVGLAAPQIGVSVRLFVVDASPFDEEHLKDFKKVFINPEVVHFSEETWSFNEGCLSIPDVREDVVRSKKITVRYFDETFTMKEEMLDDIPARIFLHEFDHLEGVLFTDRIPGLRRTILGRRLEKISKGLVQVDYKMRFPYRNKKR